MARVYNFSAGPAVLPEEVLREAADEMLDYRGCGMSVMEMSPVSYTHLFGVTRERIRQIESKTLAKLRHPSRSSKLKDYLED